jgi:cadmium resistance protein CadD (predicted permease)
VASFTSTNIDDILVLMLFFSQVNSNVKKHNIVIGQYLGIGALTIISIIGALGVSIIPQKYVGLLGLVPIYLGIKAYVDHKKESIEDENFINASIATVCGVTIANGGDNIGIYIPFLQTWV